MGSISIIKALSTIRSSDINKSQHHLENNYRQSWESNPVQLVEKQVHYLWAIQPKPQKSKIFRQESQLPWNSPHQERSRRWPTPLVSRGASTRPSSATWTWRSGGWRRGWRRSTWFSTTCRWVSLDIQTPAMMIRRKVSWTSGTCQDLGLLGSQMFM